MTDLKNFDVVIIGSGFGGSVAALRLAEKGYSVAVLESGRRFHEKDFPNSSWNLRKFLFFPRLGCKGIMRVDVFKGLATLSGAGVGGGSLVYANTLIEPNSETFTSGDWPKWYRELSTYYPIARQMLGVTPAPQTAPADLTLRAAAKRLGIEDVKAVDVAVYFGDETKDVPDPYFGGEGPPRRGCSQCGRCMIGCATNAKNTLDKNYLYLAEKKGAKIFPETEAFLIRDEGAGRFTVQTRSPGWGRLIQAPVTFSASKVIVAAGTIGTVRLLLNSKVRYRTLPNISDRLGEGVKTNSEVLTGVSRSDYATNYSTGVAIATSVPLDRETSVEAVRYPAGSDFMGLLVGPKVLGKTPLGRLFHFIRQTVANPLMLGLIRPRGFATRGFVLLFMQTSRNGLDLILRPRLGIGPLKLTTRIHASTRPPATLPVATAFTEAVAKEMGGRPASYVTELIGMSFTAHILGGCKFGASASDGVIDDNHEVFGHPGLFVVGGAAVPANLGANPSLTIAAMAERMAAKLPTRK